MFSSIGSVVLNVLLAAIVLLLPGLALLRLCVPRRFLDTLCRVTLAPGISISLNVIAFTWFDLFGIRPGRLLPWILITGSAAIFFLVRANSAKRTASPSIFQIRSRTPGWNQALIAASLLATLILFLVVRFRATWRWDVPPGVDTDQHAMIVQLLLEHGGLFRAWTPYNEAQTFTYHFGFHAITATFAWLSGLNAPAAIYIMGRMVGAAAAASLFALVRLWTRSGWGGVFAVALWEVSSQFLLSFELTGRWTLLAGLTSLTSALVLLALYLRPGRFTRHYPLALLTGGAVGGVVLTQYKTAIIMTVLAASLFVSRSLVEILRPSSVRSRRIMQLAARIAVIAGVALILAGPRLHSVMEAKAGRHLKRIVLESPAAAAATFDQPTLGRLGIFRLAFETPRKALVSILAGIGVLLAVLRRRQALWFVFGWFAITVLMNPAIIGSSRLGLIDETHWKLAIEPAIAALAGLTIGIILERSGYSLGRFPVLPVIGLATIALIGTINLEPVDSSSRYVLPDDVRMIKWIEQNVPPGNLIAGRGFPQHGEIAGRDGMLWITVLTRHRTNHTNLAAAMETGPLDYWRRLRDFTTQLYARDMSTAESAAWMRDQGFRWFYVGALNQHQDWQLLDQLARNPAIEIAHVEGAAWLYRVK